MVVVVEIRNREALTNIQRIVDMFPLAVEDAGNDFGESAARRLRREVSVQGLIWRGKLLQGIRWVKQSGIGGELRMPLEGVYVDSMRPHWVKLKRGRLIRQWAYEKGHYIVRAAATAQRSIFVKPHPFIKAPIERTIADLTTIIKRHTGKVMQTRGRSK